MTALFTALWILIVAAWVAVELWAVRRKARGDTFSENYWRLQKALPWIRLATVPLWLWAGWHLFVH